MPKPCQIADITIDVEGDVAHLKVPAYTRTWEDLELRLDAVYRRYKADSMVARTKSSVADYAMFLLASAAKEEPTEMED